MTACVRIAPPPGRTLRLGDLPSVAAAGPGVERVTLDDLVHGPTLDDALRDSDLFELYVRPYGELIEEARS